MPGRQKSPAEIGAYRAANPLCELHGFLKRNRSRVPFVSEAFQAALITDVERLAVDVHHIFKNRKNKQNLLSNMISVCRPIHRDYCEGEFQREAQLFCLSVKLRKGELNVDEITQAAGYGFFGWLLMDEPHKTHWVRPFWEDLYLHASGAT